jgi:hypothetical protein
LVSIDVSVGKSDLGIIILPLPILTQANHDFLSRPVAEKVSMAVKSNADWAETEVEQKILCGTHPSARAFPRQSKGAKRENYIEAMDSDRAGHGSCLPDDRDRHSGSSRFASRSRR